ncbi:MAG: methyltransferase domain-containing protein [Hyphomicrobiaceae bacterium TMED74]|nr:methyltransferase type 11 [Filomicrobium sp.]RPG41670.1 MAG: methyltransferase domain-containing protein [Hyphomicrobiaceae bacterium TMED74]
MYQDVAELRAFYSRPLGHAVRRLLGHRIRARWRNVQGQTVIGLGFAAPYLGTYRDEAARIGAVMPASQGALAWPREGNVRCALVDEINLPLPDNSVDRLLGVHCLEGSESTRRMLREMWRILSPDGRLLLIVPNRSSVWARADKTPFGHGRPYSKGQLENILAEAMFTPEHWSWALHVPPMEHNLVLKSIVTIERLGARIWPAIGGIILVEARKELIAPSIQGQRARAVRGLVTVRGLSREKSS